MEIKDFQVRPISPEDNLVLARLIQSVMEEFGLWSSDHAPLVAEVGALFESYNQPKAGYWVVEKEGKVLGGAGIAELEGAGDGICELRKMYLVPEVRGQGIGTSLLSHTLQQAKSLGFTMCYLETSSNMKAAQALYSKKGFEPRSSPLGISGNFNVMLGSKKKL